MRRVVGRKRGKGEKGVDGYAAVRDAETQWEEKRA